MEKRQNMLPKQRDARNFSFSLTWQMPRCVFTFEICLKTFLSDELKHYRDLTIYFSVFIKRCVHKDGKLDGLCLL